MVSGAITALEEKHPTNQEVHDRELILSALSQRFHIVHYNALIDSVKHGLSKFTENFMKGKINIIVFGADTHKR